MAFYRLSGLALALVVAHCTPPAPSSGSPPAPADSVMDPAMDSSAVVTLPPDPIAFMTDGAPVQMPDAAQDSLWQEALRIHFNAIVIDGHADVPMLMLDEGYDIHQRHRNRHVDLPRMVEGGLDAVFFSIFVASRYGEGEAATGRARTMIAEVMRQIRQPGSIAELAVTTDDIRRITRAGKKAVLLGIEGGHVLAGSLDVLHEMYASGVRYITLTHVNTNSWADASQSRSRWNGLNDLGREMILEMNRLGMMIDISHVSDSTFYEVLATSRAPVIASHSSVRALVNHVRNMDDAMIRALAEHDGVMMINFYDLMTASTLTPEVMDMVYERINTFYGGNLRMMSPALYEIKAEQGIPPGSIEDVVNHIDYVARLVGVDHVALGSDFDGARMPPGLGDVTRLPWLTYGLLKRGYSETDIYKILGGNTLRVMEEIEAVAADEPIP